MSPFTVAQALLFMGFQTRILYRLPFLSPRDLPDPGLEPISPALHVDSLTTEPPGKPEYLGMSWQFK